MFTSRPVQLLFFKLYQNIIRYSCWCSAELTFSIYLSKGKISPFDNVTQGQGLVGWLVNIWSARWTSNVSSTDFMSALKYLWTRQKNGTRVNHKASYVVIRLYHLVFGEWKYKQILLLLDGIEEPAWAKHKTKFKWPLSRERIKNIGSWMRMLCGIAPPLHYRFIMQRMSSDIKTVDDGNSQPKNAWAPKNKWFLVKTLTSLIVVTSMMSNAYEAICLSGHRDRWLSER